MTAHDFWIEPSSFSPAVGSELLVSLRVGEHFRGDPVPRDDRRIEKFVLAGPAGESRIGGFTGSDPAGLVRIGQPGVSVIGYRSYRSPITLEPEKFEKYLSDEGLDRVLETRRERGEREKPGREVYSRCAKAIVVAGGQRGPGWDRALGMRLELVLESDPSAFRPGAAMRFRLLYENRPLAGALIKAIRRDEPAAVLSARSGRDGRVDFSLAAGGVWLIKAVHMIPAGADADADWESLWASLTFEVP